MSLSTFHSLLFHIRCQFVKMNPWFLFIFFLSKIKWWLYSNSLICGSSNMWTSQNRTMIRRNSFYTFVSGRLFSTSSHTDVSQSERLHVEACSGLGRLPTWWALVLTLGVQERHHPKSHISSSKVKFMTNCFTGWVDVYVLFSVWNLCFTVRASLAFLAWAFLMTPNDWIWTIVFNSFKALLVIEHLQILQMFSHFVPLNCC